MHFQISTIFFMVPGDISKIFSIVLNIVKYESGLNINSFTAPSDVTHLCCYFKNIIFSEKNFFGWSRLSTDYLLMKS